MTRSPSYDSSQSSHSKAVYVLGLACALTGLGAWAQGPTPAGPSLTFSPAIDLSSDSDSFDIRRTSIDIQKPTATHTHGIRLTDMQYKSPGTRLSGQRLDWTYQQGNPIAGQGLQLALGISEVANHQQVLGDLLWSHPLSKPLTLSLEASRNWVESELGLAQGLYSTAGFAILEYQATERLLLIGMAGQESFSDGNTRNHQRARVIYDLAPTYGVATHWRYRRYTNSSPNPNYFSPNTYEEQMALISWRRRHEGWMAYALLGLGQQQVNRGPSTSTRLLELRLTSPASARATYGVHMGYSNSANSQRSDRYHYRYIKLVVEF